MKIIDPDIDARIRRAQFRRDHAQGLSEDLRNRVKELRLLQESSLNSGSIRNTAFEFLRIIIDELQTKPLSPRTRHEVREVSRLLRRRKALEEARHLQTSFHLFPKLPPELQLKIWQFAARAEPDPKVHCIDLNTDGPYFSNQGIPPLTRVSSLSRSVYRAQTGREPAFSTYINFQTDVVYARRFDEMPYAHSSRYDYDPFSPEDYTERLERFLGCADAEKIQRLAVTCDFFCRTRYFNMTATWDLYMNMVARMPLWRELLFVFHDERSDVCAWRDTLAAFTALTARQKRRKWVDVKVRYDIRDLGDLAQGDGLELPRFSLVCVE